MKSLSILMPSDTVKVRPYDQGMGHNSERSSRTEMSKEISVVENGFEFLGVARDRYRGPVTIADSGLGLLRRCTVARRYLSPPSSGGIG
jgi:hypothetical protein